MAGHSGPKAKPHNTDHKTEPHVTSHNTGASFNPKTKAAQKQPAKPRYT